EDDARVLLPEGLQPLAELAGETLVVEGEPAFIDDQQGWPSVEPAFDAMKEIGEHGGRGARADEALGFESLDARFAEALGLGVEKAAERAAEAIGLQGALQRLRLQQHRKPCQRALGYGSAGERRQRRPEMILGLRGHADLFARQ